MIRRVRKIVVEIPAEHDDESLIDRIFEEAFEWEERNHRKRNWDINVYATIVDIEDEDEDET